MSVRPALVAAVAQWAFSDVRITPMTEGGMVAIGTVVVATNLRDQRPVGANAKGTRHIASTDVAPGDYGLQSEFKGGGARD
jgi:hypothetical protein